MKNNKPILFLMLIVLISIISGCEDEIENPKACYTLKIKNGNGTTELTEPYIVDVGQSISFTNCGSADYYAFFSGVPGNKWSEYTNPADTTSKGADTNTYGDFSFSYQTAGNYILTVVLTNRKVKDPHNFKQVILDIPIQVKISEEK
jgi:hypothetical protein